MSDECGGGKWEVWWKVGREEKRRAVVCIFDCAVVGELGSQKLSIALSGRTDCIAPCVRYIHDEVSPKLMTASLK